MQQKAAVEANKLEDFEKGNIGDFFTNVHQDTDPLIVKNIEGIYLHPTRHDPILRLTGNRYICNSITGAYLFKENPLKETNKYPGFELLLDSIQAI